MAINDLGTRNQYTATAAQTVFPYTFEAFDKDDLTVEQNGTILTEGTQYTVSGVGFDAGGNVTLLTGATAGDILTIYRDMALERLTDYQNSGDFLASEVNSDFDRIWAALQQNKNGGDLAIRANIDDAILNSTNTTLTTPALRAGKALGFTSTGAIEYLSGTMPVGTLRQYSTLAALVADVANTTIGDIALLTERTTGNGGGAKWQVVDATTVTENGFDIVVGDATRSVKLITDEVIIAEQWGVFGDNAGSPYSGALSALFALTDVKEIQFPNETIYFDNSGGSLSFQSNIKYTGGPNTSFQITDPSQRCFATSSKTGFQLENIRAFGTETAGDEELYIGGGYMRFDSCTDFSLFKCESSNSFGTGLKLVLCTDFWLIDWKSNYNQFSGFEIEGCSDYLVEDWQSSSNGRYSSTDGYKPLPTAWTGTHGGRAWVVAGNASTVDQKNSLIGYGKGSLNSEYGGRVFAASTKAPTNLRIQNNTFEDNGHPAGTYGTVVLGAAKGTDFLINSDASGESDNIRWSDITVNRSLVYGSTISVDGNNHKQSKTKVNLTGAAQYVIAALAIFRGDNFYSDGFESNGAAIHVSYGSGLPTNVTLKNDKALDCLKAFNSYPNAGRNYFENCQYIHRATTAVSGEHGIQISSSELNLTNVTFDGFYRSVEAVVAAPAANITNCRTLNTVGANSGFYGAGITDQTNLKLNNNDFDTANPGILSTYMYSGAGALGRRRVIWNTNPATGGANAGANIAWAVGDRFENSANGTNWYCSVAGTPGTWV